MTRIEFPVDNPNGEIPMNRVSNLKATLIALAVMAIPLAQASTMSKEQYKAEKDRIGTTYKSDKAACASLSANAKDICVEEAKGKEKVAKAEAEYSYSGKPADQNKIAVAKAESTYAIAKEKCDDKSGNDKGVCVKQAKADETKALADAKMSKKISAAKTDATDDKRDADYKVAAEKCDSMAGAAKTSCINSAKMQAGKS